jgi:putative peptidoglycan lipid II flippase
VGYTGVKVLAPAFYALNAPRAPLVASALAVATNLVVVLAGYGHLGFRAVALGTALGSLLNAGLLLAMFERRLGGLFGQGHFRPIGRMLVAAVAMGAAAWLSAAGLERLLGTHGLRAQLATGLGPVVAGVAVYGLLTRWLGVPEAEAIGRLVRQRVAGLCRR